MVVASGPIASTAFGESLSVAGMSIPTAPGAVVSARLFWTV